MKPLLRWTFGGVKKLGIDVLRLATRRFRAIYPEFDCVVCWNNLEEEQLRKLKNLDVSLHAQRESELGYPFLFSGPPGWKGAAPGWGWKLCPPRLRLEAHELFVDNDLVIRERLPEIDDWLASSDKFIIAQGHRNDPRYYGSFTVPAGTKVCAGLFGLPPNYDFTSEILARCQELKGPLAYYDEQGLVTSIVLSKPHIIVKGVVNVKETPQKPLPPALHFIGVNRQDKHDHWEEFCRNSLLTMV